MIDESSVSGVTGRIATSIQDGGLQNINASPNVSVGPASVGLGDLHVGTADALVLRTDMTRRLNALGKEKGILILLDEVQRASIDELRHIATAIEHLIREDQNVAFVFAGLPSAIDRFINEPSLTFLRRAMPEILNSLDRAEVRTSMRHTIESSEMRIGASTLESLVDATACYPFMVRLVGYHAWQQAYRKAGNRPGTIRREDLAVALPRTRYAYDLSVIEPALGGLSSVSVFYLLGMSKDEGVARTSDVARRLNRSHASLGKYREHLLREGLIVAPRRGYVGFSMPYLREYLRQHEEQLLSLYDAGENESP